MNAETPEADDGHVHNFMLQDDIAEYVTTTTTSRTADGLPHTHFVYIDVGPGGSQRITYGFSNTPGDDYPHTHNERAQRLY